MVKLQLELGGKDPIYVCEDVDIAKAAAGIADGAFYNTGQSCCSVERIYVHQQRLRALRRGLRRRGERLPARRSRRRHDLHRPAHARAAAEGARSPGEGRGEEGREGPRRRQAREGARATGSSPRCSSTSTTRWR